LDLLSDATVCEDAIRFMSERQSKIKEELSLTKEENNKKNLKT
jgi:hypothetical protein